MALGHIGLSLQDFEFLTPSEFQAVADAYSHKEEERLHDDWARMRQLATIVVQPHSRKPIKATELLPFPWEKKERHQKSDMARFVELVNKLDNNGK